MPKPGRKKGKRKTEFLLDDKPATQVLQIQASPQLTAASFYGGPPPAPPKQSLAAYDWNQEDKYEGQIEEKGNAPISQELMNKMGKVLNTRTDQMMF